jgi:N-acetylglutamate synthase-like GNAT family acetyltransferase
LRPAAAKDALAIRALIRRVGINPFRLDWRRFTLAVDRADRMLGCGQIKPHADGSNELASIAVWPEFQGQGLGRMIITSLVERVPPPLYLTCRAELQNFYSRFGFVTLSGEQMTPYFRRLWTFSRTFRYLVPPVGALRIMRRG